MADLINKNSTPGAAPINHNAPPLQRPPELAPHADAELINLAAKSNGTTNSITGTKQQLNLQKHFEIVIASTEKETHAVAVGINGVMFMIPRDKPWVVPEAVVKTLEEAKITDYSPKKNKTNSEGEEYVSRLIPRLNVQSKELSEPEARAKLSAQRKQADKIKEAQKLSDEAGV